MNTENNFFISQAPQNDQYSFLTEQDIREINSFVNQIDITDNVLVINYGKKQQEEIAKMFDTYSNIFDKIDAEQIHSLIQQTTSLITETTSSYKSNYKKLLSSRVKLKKSIKDVHSLANELSSQYLNIDDNNDALSECYSKILQLYELITKYIIAGEKKLAKAEINLADLKQNNSQSFDYVEEYSRMVQCVETFKEKLNSLRISQTSALQLTKQTELKINNNNALKETINSILNNTLPAFEQCIIL